MNKESERSLYEECHKRFLYVDGDLICKYNIHHTQMEAEKAGTLCSNGYIKICVDYKQYWLHRIIFLMHYGYLPNKIDHKDRDRLNNRIENLRDATDSVNSINKGVQSNNTSGQPGVSFSKAVGKWHVYIKINNKRTNLGYFEDLEEAIRVRKQAEIDFGFTEIRSDWEFSEKEIKETP